MCPGMGGAGAGRFLRIDCLDDMLIADPDCHWQRRTGEGRTCSPREGRHFRAKYRRIGAYCFGAKCRRIGAGMRVVSIGGRCRGGLESRHRSLAVGSGLTSPCAYVHVRTRAWSERAASCFWSLCRRLEPEACAQRVPWENMA